MKYFVAVSNWITVVKHSAFGKCVTTLFLCVTRCPPWIFTTCVLRAFEPAQSRELKVASVTIHLVTPRMSCDQWRFPFVIGVITEVGSTLGSKVSFFCASWVLPSYCPLQLIEGGRCDREQLGVEEGLTFLLSKRHIPLCLFSVTAREAPCWDLQAQHW